MAVESPGDTGAAGPDEALSSVVARLRNELDGLRRAMRSRAVIEQAKGVLIERMGIGAGEAFDHLVELSQRTNVKLVELAAALVGTRVPGPLGPGKPDLLDDGIRDYLAAHRAPGGPAGAGQVPARRPTPRAPLAALEALQSQHQLLSARILTAPTYDEMAEVLCDISTGWPAPDVVILLLLEPDGALRLVGSCGLSAEGRSQWARVPPIPELPIVVAAHGHIPVYLAGPDVVRLRFPMRAALPYPSEAVVALPLQDGDQVLGVLGMGWDSPLDLTVDVRKYIFALAEPCARRGAELAASHAVELAAADPRVDRSWLPLVLDAMPSPVAVLAPHHDGDEIIDFQVEYANAVAAESAQAQGLSLVDGSLLALLPDVASRLLMPALTAVTLTGEPWRVVDACVSPERDGVRDPIMLSAHATRLWDRVLVSWRGDCRDTAAGRATERRVPSTPRRALSPHPEEVLTTDALVVRGLYLPIAQPVHRQWYDAFTLPDASIVLVVGEVSGRDNRATVAAGRLRQVVPAYALLGMAPAELLGACNRLFCQFEPEPMATLLVARFAPQTRELRWAGAGQVAPVCYRPDGTASVLSGPLGLPVGATDGVAYHDTTIALDKETRLLLYTNGLVARRTSTFADGLNALLGFADDIADLPAVVDHVSAALGGPPGDDLCVLAARVTG